MKSEPSHLFKNTIGTGSIERKYKNLGVKSGKTPDDWSARESLDIEHSFDFQTNHQFVQPLESIKGWKKPSLGQITTCTTSEA